MITPWPWPRHDTAARWACDDIQCLVASPNGRTLWVGRRHGFPTAFEVATGRVVATIPCVAERLTVTGDEVITYGRERTHWRHLGGAWRPSHTAPLAGSQVLAAARDAPVAIGADADGRCFWDERPLPVRTPLEYPSVALDPRGERCALRGGAHDPYEALYVVARGGEVRRVEVATVDEPSSFAWAGDDLLLLDHGEAIVCRCSSRTGDLRWHLADSDAAALTVSRDGAFAALLSWEKDSYRVGFLRAADGSAVAEWRFAGSHLAWRGGGSTRSFDAGAGLDLRDGSLAVELAPDGTWCAVACESGVAILGIGGELLGLPQSGDGQAWTTGWLPGGRLVLGYRNARTVRVFRPDAPDAELAVEHDGFGTQSLHPSPDGRRVAAVAHRPPGHGLTMVDLRDATCTPAGAAELPYHTERVWNDDGTALWVLGRDPNEWAKEPIVLWRVDAATGATRSVWRRAHTDTDPRGRAESLQRTGDDLYALLRHDALLLDSADGSVRHALPWPEAVADVWASCERHLCDARRVIVVGVGCFDLDTGACLWPWSSVMGPREVFATVGPSGRWFVTSDGEAVRIRATDGTPLARCTAPQGPPRAWGTSVSADGRWLATLVDGVPHLHRIDLDAVEAAARAADP